MGTLIDYIKWRGDLEFWQDGFNVIDNVILSCLSYVPLDNVFQKYGAEVIDIQDVNEIYFNQVHDENSPVVLALVGHIHFFHKDMLNRKVVQIVSGGAYKGNAVQIKLKAPD